MRTPGRSGMGGSRHHSSRLMMRFDAPLFSLRGGDCDLRAAAAAAAWRLGLPSDECSPLSESGRLRRWPLLGYWRRVRAGRLGAESVPLSAESMLFAGLLTLREAEKKKKKLKVYHFYLDNFAKETGN